MGPLLLFIIGVVCLLATLGFILKYVSGRWYDDDFVSNFVKGGMGIFGKIAVLLIAILFVYIVFSIIKGSL